MTAAQPRLYIGNKNYSSWSLRPWLALRWGGIDFDEVVIPLQGPGYGQSKIAAVLAVSPTGKVPALVLTDDAGRDVHVYDSLAICAWAAEQNPSLWPAQPLVRAVCRSAVAEMHSGFGGVRRDLSMNIRRRVVVPAFAADATAEIARIVELWSSVLTTHGGPWLFGQRSIADAFYAPVCARFRTYGVALTPQCQKYVDTVLNDADFLTWEQAAVVEPLTMPATDSLYT